MPGPLAGLLHDWHDFYVLAGTAAATLVGLTFVAASIGSSIFKEEHRAPMKAFITPTVVHFTSVLFTSLVVTIPSHSWRSLGGLLGAGGLAGSIYCGRILVQIIIRHSFNVDLIDRMFYALIPTLGHVLVLVSAVLLLVQSAASANLIAAALLTLLLAGIRNAWDMTVWIVLRTPSGTGPAP
ncbi:MAG: hypothetical protein ACLPKB_32785 [Xanthobacteraceae bacterium]